MDELTELLRLADAGEPVPEDLAERLWPQVRSTYRLTRARAGEPHVSTAGENERANADEPYPVVTALDDACRPRRVGRRLAAFAAAVALAVAGFVGYALSSNGDDDAPPTAASTDEADAPPRPFDELCVGVAAGVRAAVESGDNGGLAELVADLNELAARVEAGLLVDVDPLLADDIRRSANIFDQARRSLEAGDLPVAIQAIGQATVWRSPTISTELGALADCLP